MFTRTPTLLPATLLLAAACSGAKATPAPSTTGTADAKAATAPTPSPAPAPAPAADRRERIGPIDLTAPTVDLAALFPGARIEYSKAETLEGEATNLHYPPMVHVHRPGHDDDSMLAIELDRHSLAIAEIVVLSPVLETSDGVRIDMPVRALAQRLPDARCDGETCQAPGRRLEYVSLGMRGASLPAEVPDGTVINRIRWQPDGPGPKVEHLPPGLSELEPVPDDGAPTGDDDAVERCARMYVLMARCGVGLSAASGNYGRTGPIDVTLEAAREACADVTPGIAPAEVLEEEELARYEASAAKSCRAFVRAIDKAYGLDDQFGRGF